MMKHKKILIVTTADLALVRLKDAERDVDSARGRLNAACTQLWQSKEDYAAARPLTLPEREELAERAAAAKGLCCEEGLAWLLERLPEPWAQAINAWAYGALGCKGHEQYADEDAAKVRALKLDRLPV